MITPINQIALSWWGWMGPMLWQVSLLILIISAIDMLIRKWAWPQVRYALWLLVLIKLLIPPSWTLSSGIIARFQPWAQARIEQQWSKTFLSRGENKISSPPTSPSDLKSSQFKDPATAKTLGDKTKEFPLYSGNVKPVWQVYILGIWIFGMLLFIALLTIRIAKLRRWHKEQREKKTIPVWFHKLLVQTAKRLKLGQLPAIVFSDQAVTPAVYGVFRPVMILPVNYLDSLSREEAEHVLLHELAHLKRGDLWINGLCLLLQIVYWFNPLLIWARKQMKYVREICCDLTLASILREKTKKYRQTLLNTARELLTESVEPGMGLLGVFEEPFRLVARLRWLEKITWRNRKQIVAATCCVILAMAIFVLPMAGSKQKPSDTVQNEIKVEEPVFSEEESQDLDWSLSQKPGDIYMREVYRTDSYFLWILMDSDMTNVAETWIGNQKVVYSEKGDNYNRKVILDLEKNSIVFINHRAKTYVEATLPLDRSSILSEELKWQHLERPTSGRIDKTNKTRLIKDKKCDEYDVVYWDMRGEKRFNRRAFKVWATTDVPFNLNLYYQMLMNLREVGNRDKTLRNELKKLKGIQMKLEMKSSRFIFSKMYITELTELTRKEPPEGLYSVPSDYTKKELFTRWAF
jgi:beta-lactamase regulating signal transducer with metallopeptidase domain